VKQFVFRASERLLAFQNEEFLHRNAGECGESAWVGYQGETLLVATDMFISDSWYGIRRIEGSGTRVVFALERKREDK
jgi:hypothetical protein